MTSEKLFTWVSRRHCGYYEFEVLWIIYIILGKPIFGSVDGRKMVKEQKILNDGRHTGNAIC